MQGRAPWGTDAARCGALALGLLLGVGLLTAAPAQVSFTDDPLAPATAIKAVHLTELRTAVDTARARYGLAPFPYTDPTLTLRSTPIKAVHIIELRAALTRAYQAGGLAPPSYTDPVLVPGTTVIKAVHLTELRTAVRAAPVSLTVAFAGTGSGTVSSSPLGIACSVTCSHSFYGGAPVTLVATPSSDSAFAGWSGGCSGMGPCTVTLNTTTTVTATFTLQQAALTVTPAGTGTGTVTSSPPGIACGATCTATFATGVPVTLTALPDAGFAFTGWSGACAGAGSCTLTLNANTAVTATFAPAIGRFRLPTRGLYVQFERRGWASEYWSGEVLEQFNNFDSVVGNTVAAEAALQLDKMRAMGVNTISFELRTADGGTGSFTFPTCPIPSVLGLTWPQPTSTELTNLQAFFDLVQSKGMRLLLRLVNTHMEEQPPTNSQTWLGAILPVVKDHPALDLILFEGDAHVIDTDGDGIPDACGIPAEPPLWLGPTMTPATYVKWAISYAMSLGLPARKLSAEAIVGDFFTMSQPPGGPGSTDGHLWDPITVLKQIFDSLGIPAGQRTYALSFYEHWKCATARNLPCTDADAHTWADQTLQSVLATVGTGNGARVVAPEMGDNVPVNTTPAWRTKWALESLVFLMEKYGVDGGSFWRWTSFMNSEDTDPTLADPVKRRGVAFIYNPVQKEVLDMGGFHLTAIPNGSFESGASTPDNWTIAGNGAGTRYFLAGEAGQPEVPSRGSYALRLVTGGGATDAISAMSAAVAVSPNTGYTTTANLRFAWTNDPNPGGGPATRPQVLIAIHYLTAGGTPSAVRAVDLFPFFQEDTTFPLGGTPVFGTFPVQYTTPSDAAAIQIEVGAARNGLPTAIILDADYLR